MATERGDRLNKDMFDALPHQLYVTRYGEDRDWKWPLRLVCVRTGLSTMDVCGLPQNLHYSDVKILYDADLNEYDPDEFWLEDDGE